MLGQLTRDSRPEEVAQAIVEEAIRRGYTRDEVIAVLADAIQESGLRPKAESPNGKWRGIYQQDTGYPGRDNPNENIKAFLDRLDQKRRSDGASPDIWKNIFWLQQRPSERTAEQSYTNGRRGYLTEIKSRINEADAYYRQYAGEKDMPAEPAVSGDPTWLEDVLRPALGARLRTLPGWEESGHGDFKDLRGVMVHHTGNSRETAQSIRNGRPDLEGPLANLHIAPDGIVTIVAVGVCWHAGAGSYPWLPTDMANWHMIGIECAWPDPAPQFPNGYDPAQRWPDAQIISMRDTCAALIRKLRVNTSHTIGHKEYAGSAQGKWDPGNLDMNWFRGEVQKDLDGFQFPGEGTPQPGPILPPEYEKETWDQVRRQWPQLGNQTIVNALGEVRDKVCNVSDYANWKSGQ